MGIPEKCFLISCQLLNAIAPILASPTNDIPLANAAATVCIWGTISRVLLAAKSFMRHSEGPSAAGLLYLPAPHAVHVPPEGPHQPALQVQLLTAVLCSGELDFAGQLLQLSAPNTFLYLPSPHGPHVVPPSAPDQPALQVQFVILMLAIGESELAGQYWQRSDPAALLYFPVSHSLHMPP